MAVAVTNSPITDFNTLSAVTNCPATSSVIDATEVFTITPTRRGSRVLIEMGIGDTHGAVAYSIAAGGFPQSKALTGSIAQNTTKSIVLDGVSKSATGTYVITFTPASGKRLLTDHALGVKVHELPF